MAFWKEDDEDYWNESDTKSKAKAFNFEEDEYGSQLCGVSRSGAARLGQQVRAGMDSSTTPHSTDSLAGSFSKGMVLEGPEISIRPLGALISDEALRCIIDAAAGRPRFTKGPVNVEEEVRILRRQFENRWTPPPVDETIKKILLGRPFSLELYRSLALKAELLDAAINMGDGNAILGVVLFLMKTLKKSQVYQLLRTRPAAVNQYSHYLTTRLQVNELTDLLEMLGRSQECSMKQFQLAVQATHNPQRRIHKLKACLNNHFLAPNKDRQFVENYVKLLEWQISMAGTDAELCKTLVGQSVLGSLSHACRHHWGEPRGTSGSPLTLSSQQGVSARQFQWTVLNVRASLQAWDDIDGLFITKSWLGGQKVKSVVLMERVVEQLHRHKAPYEVLFKYLGLIDNLDKRMAVARRIKCHKAVIDVFVLQRDRQALTHYKASLLAQSEDYFYAENALRATTTKWKN